MLPKGGMKMKKLFSVILSLTLIVSIIPVNAQQIFSDVPKTHIYYDEIMLLLEHDVIDESSSFGLNDIVTREEVAVMIARAVGLDGTPRATKFSDVPITNPNSGYIQSAVEAGIINGYPDGTFKPNEKVTRGHMAAFIARAFDLPAGNKTFSDVPQGHTAYEAVKQLAAANITTGYEDGTFKPQNNLTRAHISVFLARAIQYESGTIAAYDVIIEFPADRYPQTAAHIVDAIENGWSAICTIDRDGAEERRNAALAYMPTRHGYDRDEWPMAMCEEGGAGASVAYVESSDNRGAGAWVGNQLEPYPDGTRVLFKVVGNVDSTLERPEPQPQPEPKPEPKPEPNPEVEEAKPTNFKNCTELRKVYPDGVPSGHPAYQKKMDRDNDGWACEK